MKYKLLVYLLSFKSGPGIFSQIGLTLSLISSYFELEKFAVYCCSKSNKIKLLLLFWLHII